MMNDHEGMGAESEQLAAQTAEQPAAPSAAPDDPAEEA